MPTTDRDLDIALARALGWQEIHRHETTDVYLGLPPDHDPRRGQAWTREGHHPIPRYRQDWAGLGLLVEAMRERGFGWGVEYEDDHASVHFWDGPGGPSGWAYNYERPGADLPAIAALAAARALGLAVEE